MVALQLHGSAYAGMAVPFGFLVTVSFPEIR